MYQHLHLQDRTTRVSAVYQAFDKDIRRYLREGVIVVPPSADVPEIIAEIKKYIRRQRNPLLDRLDFSNRRQQRGESFDSFMTALKELFSACDFLTLEVCSTFAPKFCQDCPNTLKKASENTRRDRIVVGVHDNDTRHKLLAHENLTMMDAVRICRSEEAAKNAGVGIPQPAGSSALASVNAVKRSTYQRQKQTTQPKSSTQTSSATSRCPKCGCGPHAKSACPANGRQCNDCNSRGHFVAFCPKKMKPPPGSDKKIGQLKLRQAASPATLQVTLNIYTRLNTESSSTVLAWVPDTGSDVDAIGLNQLDQLGGFRENLSVDEDIVTGDNGQETRSLNKIDTTLQLDETTHDTAGHVYEELTDALLSRRTLIALGVLPSDWPDVTHVRRLASPSASPPDVIEVRHLATSSAQPLHVDKVRLQLLVEFSDVFATSPQKPMHCPGVNIELQADAKPSCVRSSRPIPYALGDQIKAKLDEMVADHIIEPVSKPSSWCHPIVIVDKKGTSEKRVTVDFKKPNDQVKRPAHPVKTARDIVTGIGSAKFFSKLDARHGYRQVPLAEFQGDDNIHHAVQPLSVPSQPARVDLSRRRIQLANRRCLPRIAEFRENRRGLPHT